MSEEEDQKKLKYTEADIAKAKDILKEQERRAEEEQKAQEKSVLAQEKARDSDTKTSEARQKLLTRIGVLLSKIFKPVTGLVRLIVRDLAPYIALIIFIVLIILIIVYAAKPSAKAPNPQYKPPDYWAEYSPLLKKYLNYFNTKINSTDRPKEVTGRCDMMEWKQEGGAGNSGLCTRVYSPDTIRWTFDVDKFPDLTSLPEDMYQSITANGDRLTMYIPWSVEGSFYVPMCSQAYFKIQNPDGTVTNDNSASKLLKDNGMSCERLVKDSMSYTIRYRPKNSNNLYNYASEDDPKCST